MLSSVIGALRVFKGLYDLSFSEDQFYVQQRAEFLGGIHRCIEAKDGWRTPAKAETYVRQPFKVLLGILIFVVFMAVAFGGR